MVLLLTLLRGGGMVFWLRRLASEVTSIEALSFVEQVLLVAPGQKFSNGELNA
jgi:hypothetical protein